MFIVCSFHSNTAVVTKFKLVAPSDEKLAKRLGFNNQGALRAPPSMAPAIQAWLREASHNIHILQDAKSIKVSPTSRSGVFKVQYKARGPAPTTPKAVYEAQMNDELFVDPDDDGNFPVKFHSMEVLVHGTPDAPNLPHGPGPAAGGHSRQVKTKFWMAAPSDKVKAKRLGFSDDGVMPAPASMGPTIQKWLRARSRGLDFMGLAASIQVLPTTTPGVFQVRYSVVGPAPTTAKGVKEAARNHERLVDPDDARDHPVKFHGMYVVLSGLEM
jgi:hypothetical protein